VTESPLELVQRFCDTFAGGDLDVLMAFFAEDAIYHNIPVDPVQGVDAIRATIEGFSGGVERVEFEVLAIAADGGTVLTERIDSFFLPGKRIDLPVMGTFEVADAKITAWRDYFDLNQFMSQLG
jgi:limonene-1,2-epoxide hydrolase